MHKSFSPVLRFCVSLIAFAALAVVVLPSEARGQLEDADQLVRDVVANELTAQQQDQSLWQYQETKEQGGKTQRLEIVETGQGDLWRVVAVNGQPLTPQQEHDEDGRIHQFLSNPQMLQNQRQKQQKDLASERHLLSILPDAFRFQDAGKDGVLVKLDFVPNPAFHPSDREEQVFHHLEGSVWLDPIHKRVARVTGHVTSEVKFGGGILGHVAEGSTFLVEQREVTTGHWRLTKLEVNVNGKALFFKTIDVKQNVQNTDFKLLEADITLQQGARMLVHVK